MILQLDEDFSIERRTILVWAIILHIEATPHTTHHTPHTPAAEPLQVAGMVVALGMIGYLLLLNLTYRS